MKIYTKGLCICKRKSLYKIFRIALEETGNIDDIELTVKIVSEKEIQKLNKTHRNIDRITDVLSFPMTEIKAGEKIEKFKDEMFDNVYLGDIAICKRKAKQQAKEFGHSYNRELYFLALHGFLHIMGYDHMTKDDEKQMMGLAEKVLEKAGYGRKR